MAKFCRVARLPAMALGLITLFVADRYFGAESYHMVLRVIAFVFVAGALGMTLALAGSALGRNRTAGRETRRMATRRPRLATVPARRRTRRRRPMSVSPDTPSRGTVPLPVTARPR